MTIEANVWNKNNSSWRELTDSATVSVDVATSEETKFNVVAGSIGATQLANGAVTTDKIADGAVTLAKLNAAVLASFMTRGRAHAMMARADMN